MAGLTNHAMQRMTEQIEKDQKCNARIMAPVYAKYRKYFARKAAERAATEPEVRPGEKLFDIRDWMAEPSPLSVTFVGLNPDPMKSKVMAKHREKALLMGVAPRPEAQAPEEDGLTLPDWEKQRDPSEAGRPARPKSASVRSASLPSERGGAKRPSSAVSRSTASGSSASEVSGSSGTSITPSQSASNVGSRSSVGPSASPSAAGGVEARQGPEEGSSLASSYLSASTPSLSSTAKKARPKSASSAGRRSAGSVPLRPASAQPRARSVASGERALLEQVQDPQAAEAQERLEYVPTPKSSRPASARPAPRRAQSAGSIGQRGRSARGPSAAQNFLTQTLALEPNPHLSLPTNALYGSSWGLPCRDAGNPFIKAKSDMDSETKKDLLRFGFSHEGEGTAGYLRARYSSKLPPQRNVIPATCNMAIGFDVPLGEPMKFFPAKQATPGVRDFYSRTRNTGLRRPELGRKPDDAMYANALE